MTPAFVNKNKVKKCTPKICQNKDQTISYVPKLITKGERKVWDNYWSNMKLLGRNKHWFKTVFRRCSRYNVRLFERIFIRNREIINKRLKQKKWIWNNLTVMKRIHTVTNRKRNWRSEEKKQLRKFLAG